MPGFSFPPLRCLLLALLMVAGSAGAEGAGEITRSSRQFTSGERTIQVDCVEPKKPGPHPVILVLHGAGGMVFDGPEMRRVATRLAEAGNAAYLVHYFNRTHDVAVRDARMQENFDRWLGTVREAILWAGAPLKPGARARPVGIYGYSLGAFLALAAASDNPQVRAVAEQAGGIWNQQEARIGRMPPVMMVHGREDQRVLFNKYAAPLVVILKRRGVSPETHFFPGEGHGFTPTAQGQAREDVVKFFARRLRAG